MPQNNLPSPERSIKGSRTTRASEVAIRPITRTLTSAHRHARNTTSSFRGGSLLEPASATSSWAKIAGALKDWPLWLFVAVAPSLSVFTSVPQFRELVAPAGRTVIVFATIVAWIFTASRAVTPIMRALHTYGAASEGRIKFVVTPIEHQCLWGVSKEPDGSFVTQVSGHFLVKNRTDELLYLTTLKLIRPRIHGEVLSELLTMQSQNSNIHGTAHVSGYFIPPQATSPVAALILIRGVPRQKSGIMSAVLEMADANAHKERVRLKIECFNPSIASS
jgi:hypothetical protein